MGIKEDLINVKHILVSLCSKLTGGEKRRAAAEIAKAYGRGGQRFVSKELGMSRNTIRKGEKEIESGEIIEDKFNARGRKKKTDELPELEAHIRSILDAQSQADPKFQTGKLYTNISIAEVRKQLIEQYDYNDEELPAVRTLNSIINDMNYTVKSVKKSTPLKKIPETDMIFDNLDRIHKLAAEDDEVVRLSIDTKDRVKVGDFSRGGKSRVEVNACDHDFGDEYVTPFGIMDVKSKNVEISISETKVTADFMVDRIEEYWVANGYSGTGKSVLLNADNGPENNSSRTQFIKRMVQFSVTHDTPVTLAYYPPYHSKYNPIERVWGVLEQHWNGSLLDTKETVVKYAETMTYDKQHPVVKLIDQVYETGVKVGKAAMKIYENALERVAGLSKWFVRISPQKCLGICSNESASLG